MHTKDKVRCTNYLTILKNDPEIAPFLVRFENSNSGYYGDYEFIVLRKDLDINTIERKLKANKYATVKDFYKEVKAHFENFAAFSFEGDEVNLMAKKFIKLITEAERSHTPVSEA